ncbi:hypothetical protein EPN42_09850 [bacterium]|nr:MAG: hypothetical protein EPN42_09850 [bacterium]
MARALPVVAVGLGIGLALTGIHAKPSQAMPPFAQAYGVSCDTCHTMVPALNAYGRYVQHTAYASLDPTVLKDTLPIWVGEQINGDSAGAGDPVNPTHTVTVGNLALHAVGYIGRDWTYHFQQWLYQNDQSGGGLDTAWVTYNNLFHRDGHLFIGKIEAPGPSPFSQWFDLSGFATPEIAVGEHAWQLDGNRWGTKLGYFHKPFDLEAGWLAGSGDLVTGTDFDSNLSEKTFQWKAAYAPGDRPLEAGLYGSIGTFPLAEAGQFDRYHSLAAYAQRDPQPHGVPGAMVIYQSTFDGNAGLDANGNALGALNGHAFTGELYEPLFKGNALIAFRHETGSVGGVLTNGNNLDFAFNVPHMKYLHGYFESAMGAKSAVPSAGPEWKFELWWTTPIANAQQH